VCEIVQNHCPIHAYLYYYTLIFNESRVFFAQDCYAFFATIGLDYLMYA